MVLLCCCHTFLTLTSLCGFQIQEETKIYRLSPAGKTEKGAWWWVMGQKYEIEKGEEKPGVRKAETG